MILPLLEGSRLYLRALVAEDADGDYPDWLNDQQVSAGNSHGVFPYSPEAARQFIKQTATSRDALTLAIVLKDENRHIGNIALQSIQSIYRSAELSILIGAHIAWGKGYGLEAARMLCAHGFARLNLHRIGCGTFSDNTAMQRLALALGMRKEGERREAAFKNGRFVNIVEFGMLRDEFKES